MLASGQLSFRMCHLEGQYIHNIFENDNEMGENNSFEQILQETYFNSTTYCCCALCAFCGLLTTILAQAPLYVHGNQDKPVPFFVLLVARWPPMDPANQAELTPGIPADSSDDQETFEEHV